MRFHMMSRRVMVSPRMNGSGWRDGRLGHHRHVEVAYRESTGVGPIVARVIAPWDRAGLKALLPRSARAGISEHRGWMSTSFQPFRADPPHEADAILSRADDTVTR